MTDIAIKAAKPRSKPYKLADGGGMYLEVAPAGGKWWRWKYRIGGKEKRLSLGVWPDVSLKVARERRDAARRLLADGADPGAQRKADKATVGDTLEAVANRYFAKRIRDGVDTRTVSANRHRLEVYLYPSLGQRPMAAILAPDLLAPLRRIEATGKLETAGRIRSLYGSIARFALAEGIGGVTRDISADLKGALASPGAKHHATILDPVKVGELLRAIDGYQGQPSVMYALRLAPLVFVRPGELRGARWDEFTDLNGEEPLWRIPGERMKMNNPHLVPLSPQAVSILKDVHALTGTGTLVFPGIRTPSRSISNNTLNAALRRLGYGKDEQTAHGFRAMARTLLAELGWMPDAIERQLAHKASGPLGAAYDRAQFLKERRKMMVAWADYLDTLRAATSNVVAFRKVG